MNFLFHIIKSSPLPLVPIPDQTCFIFPFPVFVKKEFLFVYNNFTGSCLVTFPLPVQIS